MAQNSGVIRPFLKWAGGKHRLLDKITDTFNEGNRLVEPFVGSGAVFLGTDFPSYLLADSNPDLINLYQQLVQNGEAFIEECTRYFNGMYNSATAYYELRDNFNRIRNRRKKAQIFLYLNRHSYNGLCRYNLNGDFNVPFGKYAKPYFPEKELLKFLDKCRSRKVVFKCQPFEKTFGMIKKGDLVYCDPPYFPLSLTANFTTYATNGFSLQDQQTLARYAEEAMGKGIKVVISNHDMANTRELYKNASLTSVIVSRMISCKGDQRNKVKELIAAYEK